MNIGEHYITKAYYGTHEITLQQNAYVGTVPMIEDLQPEIWYPFSEDLANHGKLDMTGIGNIASTMTLDSENHYAKSGGSTGGGAVNTIETNATTHEVYARARTVNDVEYPAHEITAMCWIRLSRSRLENWLNPNGSKTFYFSDTFVEGYLSGGEFYEDSELTIPITPDRMTLYINKSGGDYYWNGTEYISLTTESTYNNAYDNTFCVLGGAEHYKTYFGLMGFCRETKYDFNTFQVRLQMRNNGTNQVGLKRIKLDTWLHFAFTYNPINNLTRMYYNGTLFNYGNVSSSAIGHNKWMLQADGRLEGNFWGIQVPLEYKDIRIYSKVLSKETIKHIYSQGYEPLEYIEGTGTQYLEINYKPNNNTQVECTLMTIQDNPNGGWYFGSRKINQVLQFGYLEQTSSLSTGSWRYGSNALNFNRVTQDGVLQHIVANANKLYVNNTLVATGTSQTFVCPYNMHILCIRDDDGINSGGTAPTGPADITQGRIYNFIISENNTELIHLIPVRRLLDGKACLYDTINKVFYTNKGTGDFIAAPT